MKIPEPFHDKVLVEKNTQNCNQNKICNKQKKRKNSKKIVRRRSKALIGLVLCCCVRWFNWKSLFMFGSICAIQMDCSIREVTIGSIIV